MKRNSMGKATLMLAFDGFYVPLAAKGLGQQKISPARSNPARVVMKVAGRHLNWQRVAASLIVFMIGACVTTFLDSRLEHTIRKELPRLVGPADRYDVDVSGARVSGEIADLENVHVVGARINRPKTPVIDRLEVDLSNVVVDRKEKRLKSLSAANAQARMLATDIAAFLDAKPGLDNVNVTLHPPDEITISAQPSIARYALPKAAMVKVRGRLVVESNEVNLEVIDLRAAGFSVGAIPKLVLEKVLNPIIDLSALPVPSQVTSVTVTEAVLVEATGGTTLRASR